MNRILSPILNTAAAWWEGRTLREQRMVMIGGGLLLAVIVWLGVVRPLWAWREDAADARVLAEADQQRVATALTRLAPSESGVGPAPDLQAAVAEVGAQTGLTPVMGMAGDGNLGFSLPDVSTTAAFGWLSALRDRQVEAVSLSVVENADATLTVEGSLAAAP